MQLKKSRAIRNKLAIASSALLLTTPVVTTGADKLHFLEDSKIGISQLVYDEFERLRVDKYQALMTKELSETDQVKLNLVYDTMSGASPNGRVYSIDGEIYTPGGNSGGNITYTTASGNANTVSDNSGGGGSAPWKTNFTDTRKSINGDWEHRFLPTLTSILGGGVSIENDYQSRSFSGKVQYEINQRRTTLTAGAAVSNDIVNPFGGVPTGASELVCYEKSGLFLPNWNDLDCDNKAATFKAGNKVSNDYLVGITQVWNRRTLMQFNFSTTNENGYLTDPYKQVSVMSSISESEVTVLYEKRPNTRNRKSFYFKVVHLPTDYMVLHTSYRYYWDDWNVKSDTFDNTARINLGSRIYFQTHLRSHWQTAASFFRPYVGGDAQSRYYFQSRPTLISADSRLSGFFSWTAGVKIGVKISKESEISFRYEEMTQAYQNLLLPDMKATIMQLNIYYKF